MHETQLRREIAMAHADMKQEAKDHEFRNRQAQEEFQRDMSNRFGELKNVISAIRDTDIGPFQGKVQESIKIFVAIADKLGQLEQILYTQLVEKQSDTIYDGLSKRIALIDDRFEKRMTALEGIVRNVHENRQTALDDHHDRLSELERSAETELKTQLLRT